MSVDVRDLIGSWVEQVWNRRRDRYVDLLMAPDALVQVEGVDGHLDRDAFLVYRKAFYEAVPDFQLEIRGINCEDNVGFLDWRFTGTHRGPGLGIPPSGRIVEAAGISRFEFEEGRLFRGADRWNRGELMAALMSPASAEMMQRAGLTVRESQVALLMADRHTSAEIATRIGVSRNTARRHCESVLRKLGLSRRRDVGEAIGKVPGTVMHRHGSDVGNESQGG
jgi:steroid delta-isomerase-like uncharacterized protein